MRSRRCHSPKVDLDIPRLHLPELFPFWTPNTPDLGCFVRQKHGLETYDFHVYGQPSPWEISGGSVRFLDHQAYLRVKCGEAGFFQRCLVYMRDAIATVTDVLGLPPDWVLGGDYLPYPSEWLKYPPQSGGRTYFFAGEHRNPAESVWRSDAAVGHAYDIYDNGTLATVHWDDTGGDRDFDDFVVEVAVVRRRRFFADLVFAEQDEDALRRFTDEIEPELERPDRSYAEA
jgi:hypothetical protein